MPALKDARYEAFALALARGAPIAKTFAAIYPGERNAKTCGEKAARLHAKPAIKQRIAEIKAQLAVKTPITAQRVLEEMAKIAFSNIGDFFDLDENGVPRINMAKVTKDQMAIVSEITIEEKNGEPKVRFKLHDKRAALSDLGKHFGLFKDKLEVSGPDGGPIKTQNSFEVSLLAKDEREMLKQLLLIAAQRKAERESETPMIEHQE